VVVDVGEKERRDNRGRGRDRGRRGVEIECVSVRGGEVERGRQRGEVYKGWR
jgi:hypothetical protein